MTKRYSIATLGCKINQIDSASIGKDLEQSGYCLVPFGEKADLVIVNTCAVTSLADRDGRKLTAAARKNSPDAIVIVTGCSPGISQDPSVYKAADIVCTTDDKGRILELIARKQIENGAPPPQLDDDKNTIYGRDVITSPGKTRAFFKVQDGCDFSCAYCIVPIARGNSRSVPFDQAVAGFERLALAGYKEVVLSGIHLGAFGKDLHPKSSLDLLLDNLAEAHPNVRIRLSSIEPREVTDEIIALFSRHENLCGHLHIPMQSGSDKILKAMGRPYDRAFFIDLMDRIEKAVSDVTLGADIIVGFPGETNEDFQNTVDLVAQSPLAHLHVFRFSQRSGTRAEKMSGQVAFDVIKARSAAIRKMDEQKRIAHYSKFIGRTLSVVSEGEKSGGHFGGMSGNYIPVRFCEDIPEGRMVSVLIEKIITADKRPALFGRVVLKSLYR